MYVYTPNALRMIGHASEQLDTNKDLPGDSRAVIKKLLHRTETSLSAGTTFISASNNVGITELQPSTEHAEDRNTLRDNTTQDEIASAERAPEDSASDAPAPQDGTPEKHATNDRVSENSDLDEFSNLTSAVSERIAKSHKTKPEQATDLELGGEFAQPEQMSASPKRAKSIDELPSVATAQLSKTNLRIEDIKPAPPVNDDPEMAAALRTAASNGDLEMIETLLDVGTNINSYDEQEGTALSKAAFWGHLSAVQTLLRKGADPNTGRGRIANIQLSFIPS
jgi:hypothetical protein